MPSRETKRVLIVEDEEMLLDIVSTEIEEEGFSVLRATTGEAALDILRGPDPVDLLFTDIRLAGQMNGWSLGERAKAVRADLPILYATGYTDDHPQNIEQSQFFMKPYRIAEVIRTIRAMLPQPA